MGKKFKLREGNEMYKEIKSSTTWKLIKPINKTPTKPAIKSKERCASNPIITTIIIRTIPLIIFFFVLILLSIIFRSI